MISDFYAAFGNNLPLGLSAGLVLSPQPWSWPCCDIIGQHNPPSPRSLNLSPPSARNQYIPSSFPSGHLQRTQSTTALRGASLPASSLLPSSIQPRQTLLQGVLIGGAAASGKVVL